MQVYKVGGAIRDKAMGLVPKDFDYVVVGATPSDMLSKGFKPVGLDFPVFLHPDTHDEYALARVERKVGTGYTGFETTVSGVTLEEDLSRRDLTINAMAETTAGELVDPFGGLTDIQARVLRHVGPAFVEDPVRVLRLARFMARFGPSWTVAAETHALAESLVASGAMTYLEPARIWKELSRGLQEQHPQLMIAYMQRLKLFSLPCFMAFSAAANRDTSALEEAVRQGFDFEARAGAQFSRLFTAQERLASKMPSRQLNSWHRIAQVTALLDGNPGDLSPALKVDVARAAGLLTSDYDERPVMEALIAQRPAFAQELKGIAHLLSLVDVKAITASMPQGKAVAVAIQAAREAAFSS